MKGQLVSIIQPGIVGDLGSYWAMHFCAVLEAMHQQKQLTYSFKRSIPDSVPQSISSLISNTPNGFFGQLKSSICNFGLQYFLCHYLMSNEGRPAVVALLNEVANAYNFDISENLLSFNIFVCGYDSHSGQKFLRSTDAVIFGYSEHTIQNVWRDINYVDLCILIERDNFPPKIAILGEVEGKNGAKLFRESFWCAKSSFCCFGVGVSSNTRKQIELQTFETNTGLKSILTLSSNFSVVEDFKVAIDTLDVLFSMGASINLPLHDGMRTVVDIVRYHWNKPVDDLISQLRSMIRRIETNSIGQELIAIPSVPKIVQ